MLGAVSINSWSKKTTFFEKTSFLCQVLDVGGGLNKLLAGKNDILITNVPKCQFFMKMTKNCYILIEILILYGF